MKYTPGARRLSALHREYQKHRSPVHLTQGGLEKLKQEQTSLLAERPQAVDNLKRARELGDLSENGFYKASRMRLSQIDSRLFQLKMLLKQVQLIERLPVDHITLGARVTVNVNEIEKVFNIVGRHEANPSEGRLSDVSPIGRALMGKKVGDKVVISTPSGEVEYEIVGIGE